MNRKLKKIVFAISSLGSGGAERVVSTLACELSQRGYQVSVIMVANENKNYPLPEAVELIKLSCEEKYQKLNVLQRTSMRISDIRKAIKESEADVLVSFMSETNIDVCFAAVGLKVSVIVSERNDPSIDPASRVKRLLRKLAYGRADGYVFQTPDAQTYFSKKIQKKSCVILNPLTANLPEPYMDQRDKRIVAVGRLNKQKNYPLLLKVFEQFAKAHPEYTLEIYGEGLLEETLHADIAQRNLQDKVILKGFCEDVHKQIRTAAFFVMTSDFEGMPNALIEAMALGLPCISTDCPCGGPRMLISSGENGLLIPIKDEEALAQAMHQLVENPELAARMGKNAECIKTQVQRDVIVDQWLAYITEIYSNS